VARRGDALAAVATLAALCWWQVIAAILDARGFQPVVSVVVGWPPDPSSAADTGASSLSPHPTWIFASVFASHATLLLIVSAALLIWVHLSGAQGAIFRSCGWAIAGCAAVITVIGAGGLADPHMSAAVSTVGGYPDTIRAYEGMELLVGAGAAVTAFALSVRALRATGRSTPPEQSRSAVPAVW
jgi:hypothetical protein